MRIRPATIADTEAVASIDRAAKQAALATVRWAHTPDAVRAWLGTVRIPAGDCWLAETDGVPLGYMALRDDWVEQLYVAPDVWRRGVGRALLEHAKASGRERLRLWCFQVNHAARAFYQRQGFVVAKMTSGRHNEEGEPDILFVWQNALV